MQIHALHKYPFFFVFFVNIYVTKFGPHPTSLRWSSNPPCWLAKLHVFDITPSHPCWYAGFFSHNFQAHPKGISWYMLVWHIPWHMPITSTFQETCTPLQLATRCSCGATTPWAVAVGTEPCITLGWLGSGCWKDYVFLIAYMVANMKHDLHCCFILMLIHVNTINMFLVCAVIIVTVNFSC